MKAKNVTMGIKSIREGLRDFADTFKAVQRGEEVKAQPEGINFTDFEAFRKAPHVRYKKITLELAV